MKGGFEKPNAIREALGDALYYHLGAWAVVVGIPAFAIINCVLAAAATNLVRFEGMHRIDQVIMLALIFAFIEMTLVLLVRRVMGWDDNG